MANKINFTKRILDELPLPEAGKRCYYNDTKIKGLQLAITDKGSKTFVVYRRINNQPTRTKIGNYPDLSPEQARNQAEILIGQIASGVDPQAEKRDKQARQITLNTCFEDFFTAKQHRLKPKTLYDYQRIRESAFGDWQSKRILTIQKNTILQRHQQLSEKRGKAYADLSMRFLQAVINLAIHRYEDSKGAPLIRDNPVAVLSKAHAWNRQTRRDTYIKEHELSGWFSVVQQLKADPLDTVAHTVSDYLQVLLLTGLRRQEAAKLKWLDIDFKDRTIKIPDTKNHETHVLPLGNYLLELLTTRQEKIAAEFVFPGNGKTGHLMDPRKHIKHIIEQSGTTFKLHDLRRTFATYAARIGIVGYGLKDLLNHKMTHDVTAGYIAFNVERLREPMQKIEDYILNAAKQTEDKIVLFQKSEKSHA